MRSSLWELVDQSTEEFRGDHAARQDHSESPVRWSLTPTYRALPRLTDLLQFRSHPHITLLEWIGKLANGLDVNQFNKCIDPG